MWWSKRVVWGCVLEVGESISSSGVVEMLSLLPGWLLYGSEMASKVCCDEHQKTKRCGVRFVAMITLLPQSLFSVNDQRWASISKND